MKAEKIFCYTPTPNKKPIRIDRWKFDLLRKIILKVVPKNGDGVVFMQLPKLVKSKLKKDDLKKIGSINWFTTVVKLDMEVKGEIYRVDGSSPQRLLRK